MKTKLHLLLLAFFILLNSTLFASGKKESVNSKLEQKSTPQKIVSLGASATEILFALDSGDKIVARTDFCNFPEQASSIPSLGGFDGKTFSIETILSYEPDFVYLFAGMHDYLIDSLNQFGIDYYISNASSVLDVCTEITEVAKILGKEQIGTNLVKSINDSIVETKNENPKKVYWEVWNSPYMTIGNTSFINDVIEKSGGINLFSDVSQSYPVVSEESIIARNPDIIIIPSDSMLTEKDFLERESWQDVTAIKNKAIFIVDGDIVSRPGPRIGTAIELVSNLLN